MDRSSVGIRAACVCPLILVAGLTAAPAAILAQVAGGEITGAVTDQAGAAVPGATVTVSSGANGQQRVVLTTADGIYAAPGLAPGEYRVDVVLAGFKAVSRDGIRIATGEKARVDFALVVG